jgi:hypothetical protein
MVLQINSFFMAPALHLIIIAGLFMAVVITAEDREFERIFLQIVKYRM